jgi:acetyltransferase-like isoleucine patch superfamily enzyme
MNKLISSVGKYTYGHDGLLISNWGEPAHVEIGCFCSIGLDVKIHLGSGPHNPAATTTFPFAHIFTDVFNIYTNKNALISRGNVTIGNDVWIGDHATILSGVNIGDGAIISTMSVVSKNVPPYTVVGGNPAEFLYTRFNKQTISKLLKYKWWTLPDNIINEISPLLVSTNVELLLERLENICTQQPCP